MKDGAVAGGQGSEPKDPQHYFRLPMDRSFSVKGFGTVVTGTLVAGQIAKEQEVELLPAAVKLRVRGLQTGGKSVDTAEAGQRTAVNLAGVESTEIQRGMTLAAPGKFRASRRIDVWLELLASARTLKQRTKVHFHAGTAETVGEIHWYEGVELAPGESGLAQIRLQDERGAGARRPVHCAAVFAGDYHWRRSGAMTRWRGERRAKTRNARGFCECWRKELARKLFAQ